MRNNKVVIGSIIVCTILPEVKLLPQQHISWYTGADNGDDEYYKSS